MPRKYRFPHIARCSNGQRMVVMTTYADRTKGKVLFSGSFAQCSEFYRDKVAGKSYEQVVRLPASQ